MGITRDGIQIGRKTVSSQQQIIPGRDIQICPGLFAARAFSYKSYCQLSRSYEQASQYGLLLCRDVFCKHIYAIFGLEFTDETWIPKQQFEQST